MQKNNIIYWVATSIVILMVGIGSIADLLKIDAVKASITDLGFPVYVLPLFGTLKILGTAAILIPALSRFKEAAYAGLIFYFAGATYCHLAVGDGFGKIAPALFILLAILMSYFYSKKVSTEIQDLSIAKN